MTDQTYYSTPTNYGTYQYIPLADIVNNFMLMHTGDEELISHHIDKYKVIFHAKRAIQEFHYDAARETKVIEIQIGDNLQAILPPDFVNQVKLFINVNGTLIQLFENKKPTRSITFAQDANGNILFDGDGEAISVDSLLNQQALNIATQQISPLGYWGWFINDNWYYTWNVTLFGIDPADVTNTPSYSIDKRAGVINFTSGMNNQTLELEYISDGLSANDDEIMINKLAEEYVYAYITHAILESRSNVAEYVVNRKRKRKSALLSNAKIRLSNLHPSILTLTLRGQDKWIK